MNRPELLDLIARFDHVVSQAADYATTEFEPGVSELMRHLFTLQAQATYLELDFLIDELYEAGLNKHAENAEAHLSNLGDTIEEMTNKETN